MREELSGLAFELKIHSTDELETKVVGGKLNRADRRLGVHKHCSLDPPRGILTPCAVSL